MYVVQGSNEIRQWPIKNDTQKNISVEYNKWLNRLNNQLNEPTKSKFSKSP